MNEKSAVERAGVCLATGFLAAGESCGIKSSGKKDVAVIVSESPADAAAVFTRNKVVAAPIIVSKRHLQNRRARAVIISSGNANAATGEQGIRVAERMCDQVAASIGCSPKEVLIAQTGLIGIPLDEQLAVDAAAKVSGKVAVGGGMDAAEAIMTTDTRPKLAHASFEHEGITVTVSGMAKGAAMLSPSMATMIALIVSDASVDPAVLQGALDAAVQDSFHMMSVDGCTSTNDTVFFLANGASAAPRISSKGTAAYEQFAQAVRSVCISLAQQMAGDGEGSTKFLTMTVTGARSVSDARRAARAVTQSLLVKCSLAGENAYWGRVLSELGASGAEFNPANVEIRYGEHLVCSAGVACPHDENAVDEYMRGREIVITADLASGPHQATAWGCDLTHGYVDENMAKS
ncbi:MAG: bifunctional glutamate N-acetyltransferase/amino-acid acetyltransferase ArgJ [Deltaproteobacteria bacterium]|nr:bifunctional glutamate N-acetyltransferase/amino-acid acetyltransferase ArgJ [Deltaproteobacteria bacterium]